MVREVAIDGQNAVVWHDRSTPVTGALNEFDEVVGRLFEAMFFKSFA